METLWRRTLVVFTVRSACERAWDFLLPVLLSSLASDRGEDVLSILTGSAGLYATRTASQIVAQPIAARFWSGTPRCTVAFLVADSLCLIAVASMLWALLKVHIAAMHAGGQPIFDGRDGEILDGDAVGSGLAAQLAGCGIVIGLETSLSKTLWNAIEKQSALVASECSADEGEPYVKLAGYNAALSRIDLASGAVVPFLTSYAASCLGIEWAMAAIVSAQLLGTILSAHWMINIFSASVPEHPAAIDEDSDNEEEGHDARSSDPRLVIYAGALLYCTVLTPQNGLLLIWLRERKVAEATIVVFVAGAQVLGAAGTFIPKLLLWRGGEGFEMRAAANVQAVHASTIVAAAGAVSGGSLSVLLLATTLSRAALWASDLLQRQIVQVQAGSKRMQEFALQDSLGQAAACCMYLFAASGASFPAQCCASALSVTISAVILAVYACRATTAGSRGNSHPLALFSEDGLGSTLGRKLGRDIDMRSLWEFDEKYRCHDDHLWASSHERYAQVNPGRGVPPVQAT